ncbi:uracil-DNA glycosylase [candidate division KSB1 bacterium]|nr:uracil-DNA glycosylase [candidate division KSB1 bacterium]
MNTENKQKAMNQLNKGLKTCGTCQLSLTRNNVLIGEGSLDTRLLLVALSPGKEEDAHNRMFIGPSGQVLDKLFKTTGIRRDSVYITNLIKCILPKNRRPKMEEIESCSRFLFDEIAIIRPQIIVPLGYYATRTILTKYHADPPPARRDYSPLYGKLLFADNQAIFPLPHPASLLYHPAFEDEAVKNYQKLFILQHECKWYSCCPMKRFYEQGSLPRKWIALYCKGLWQSCTRYQMEENGEYHPDWMLPDGSLDKNLKNL